MNGLEFLWIISCPNRIDEILDFFSDSNVFGNYGLWFKDRRVMVENYGNSSYI